MQHSKMLAQKTHRLLTAPLEGSSNVQADNFVNLTREI